MSEVALKIGGRTYRVSCAAGEEERVTRLGATISDKVASLGSTGGTDAQNLLFAALILADEAQESRESRADPDGSNTSPGDAERVAEERQQFEAKIAALEAELASARDSAISASDELERGRAREDELTKAIMSHDSDVASLRSRIAELEQEAKARAVTPLPAGGTADLSALAPALEHFAQLLEECADKLERGRVAS